MSRPADDPTPSVGSTPADTTAPGGQEAPQTVYEMVGGHETFVRLTRLFYEGVAADPPLRDMYPEEDLGPAEERLRMFLEQFFGGPTTYSQLRGHPRLRMRHVDFAVTPTQRDRWLRHMLGAMEQLDLPEPAAGMMRSYFLRSAQAMVNTLEDPEATPETPPVRSSTEVPRPRLSVRRLED